MTEAPDDRARSARVVQYGSVTGLWVGIVDGQFRVMHQRRSAAHGLDAASLFDDLYVEAILCPEALDKKVDSVVSQVKEQGRGCAEGGTA